MIVYTLSCEEGHDFEGWFKSAEAYGQEAEAGRLECPVCGSTAVTKALSAPNVATGEARDEARAERARSMQAKLHGQLRKLREEVEKTHTYVGGKFPEEARRIHYGEADARPIYGEASRDEVKDLVEEGVDVCPLPDLPKGH